MHLHSMQEAMYNVRMMCEYGQNIIKSGKGRWGGKDRGLPFYEPHITYENLYSLKNYGSQREKLTYSIHFESGRNF